MMVGLPDVITRAKLDGDRFGHFRVVGVELQVFPLTLVIVLTTLWQSVKQRSSIFEPAVGDLGVTCAIHP